MKNLIITIDGPAGSGKTTVSKALAQRLGCIYVDTGALYRGVAFELQRQKIDYKEDKALEKFLKTLDLTFAINTNHGENQLLLLSSGQGISSYIRTPEITMLASLSSAKPIVRSALLNIQRNIADEQDAVFEGRDMGTVVFPDAPFKFFLFADLAVRAKRRFDEMPEKEKDFNQVQKEMKIRDYNDSNRVAAPLKPAEDAVHINSSALSIEPVVEKMLEYIQKPDSLRVRSQI
jgi:CMP/dCMP kinase